MTLKEYQDARFMRETIDKYYKSIRELDGIIDRLKRLGGG